MKYFIKTFGCVANEADSEKIVAWYEQKGWQVAKTIQQADEIIINTCSVRQSAENRVFGLVNKLGQLNPKRYTLIVTGCMVGSAIGERKRYSLAYLQRKLPQVDEFVNINHYYTHKPLAIRQSVAPALVPIMEGCDHFCSYCVVPYARGQEISRPMKEIIEEVKDLVKRGYQEILLIGQNVNSYQPSFTKLLSKIHQIKNIKKISFLTSNPWNFSEDLIQAMKLPKIDRYLHLPVQSGDDEILKKMNRPYTAGQYLDLVKKIRRAIPEIQIGTDIIVGFPGETTKQFENTVKLCQKVGFVKAYIAKYSPRPGTAAFKLKDDVPMVEKKRRWQILEKLINKKTKF